MVHPSFGFYIYPCGFTLFIYSNLHFDPQLPVVFLEFRKSIIENAVDRKNLSIIMRTYTTNIFFTF